MPRSKHKQRRPRDKRDKAYAPGQRQNYQNTPKNNQEFETYYKAQNIVPEEEWDSFMETLRRPLPSTFRITGFKRQAKQLLAMIKSEYFANLVNLEVEGRKIEPPKSLSWYPDNLAWQLDFDRKFIRQCEEMKKLHTFLIEETESGNISRQEAVSMIPPLVLDVKPHHKVLDMCAAPGSKTAQLLELLHADDTKLVPDGCVVANDSDNKRCYLMTHQVKRLETPSFMIVNQDASCMPNFKVPNESGHMESVRFDRILADVPCSGDGTMRKNVDAWGKWNVHSGMHLHNIQSRILSRGLEMLEVGGRIVYSTCSMNPIEDEAVVSNLLRKSKGTVRLVDVSEVLPGLKSSPGVSDWKVMSRELDQFTTTDDLPPRLRSTIRPSVFPPTEEEAKQFQLHKCMRVLPHLQDTGGFFISVLEKTDELPWIIFKKKVQPIVKEEQKSKEEENMETDKSEVESAAANSSQDDAVVEDNDKSSTAAGGTEGVTGTESANGTEDTNGKESEEPTSGKRPREERPGSPKQRKRRQFGYKEDPFIFITQDDPIWPPIQEFFGMKDFPVEQLLVRCMEGKKRNVYFTSPIVKSLVKHNEDRIKIINLGLKILSRSESQHVSCPFRTVQDGLLVLFPHATRRIVQMTKEDIITLLSTEMPFLSRFTSAAQQQLSQLSQGSVIFVFDPEENDRPEIPKSRMILCGWLGKTSCRSFIPLSDRGHYLRMCGAELKSKEQRQKEARDASVPKSAREGAEDNVEDRGADDNIEGREEEMTRDSSEGIEEDIAEDTAEEKKGEEEEDKMEEIQETSGKSEGSSTGPSEASGTITDAKVIDNS